MNLPFAQYFKPTEKLSRLGAYLKYIWLAETANIILVFIVVGSKAGAAC